MSTPTTNPSWTIPLHATSPTHLTLQHPHTPVPGPHQVLIRMLFASLNFRDLLIATRSPSYPGTHKPNLVPGSDGAGVIHSAHPSSKWAGKEGMKVVLHGNTWMSGDVRSLDLGGILGGGGVDGTVRGWVVVGDESVVGAEGLSSEDAASLFTAGATAWNAIRNAMDGKLDGSLGPWEGEWTRKRLKGKWVLTQGTGGVSCFAIQILHALGATIISTSSSDAKLETAKSLGASYTINYKTTPNWDEEVLRITGGKGVDHVIEVGGAGTIMKSLNATRRGGLVNLIGILTEADAIPAEFLPSVLYSGKIVRGCVSWSKDMSEEFVAFVKANKIKPIIARTYAFDEVVEAFEELQKQNAVGKLVIKIAEE